MPDDFIEGFRATYARPQSEAEIAVDREVFGVSEGNRGYTTVAQANVLAERLGLRPGMRLLDIGSGRGWPGLYLARSSGCDAFITDVPATGLRVAMLRPSSERPGDRLDFAQASGEALPFRPRLFDAIVHTDVL